MLPHEILTFPLLSGDDGTAQTLAAMRAYVDTARHHPLIRLVLAEAFADIPERAPALELDALLGWVRDHVRFQRDPLDAEYVQNPVLMVQAIRREGRTAGDCDDMATLFAALVEAAGVPTRFVVVGPNTGSFTHVYVEVETAPDAWAAVDPSARGRGLGWAPALPAQRKGREMLARTLGEENGGFWESVGSVFESVATAAKTAVPLLERYGIFQPVTGYTPSGQPIYASATLPVGASGAAYTALTQAGPLGLSMTSWLLIGAGVVALMMVGGGKRGR